MSGSNIVLKVFEPFSGEFTAPRLSAIGSGSVLEVATVRSPTPLSDAAFFSNDWGGLLKAQKGLARAIDPVEAARFDRYHIEGFDNGVAYAESALGHIQGIASDTQFPETTFITVAGKPILEVIDHPVTRERYTAADVIERAFWDDEAQVSVFEVRRAA